MINHRLVPNAMEPRGVVAHYEPGKEHDDDLVVDAEPAHPEIDGRGHADLGEDQVRAIAPEVGGGFGAKINIYAEEYVTAALSASGSASR